jgi:hypothetical protein
MASSAVSMSFDEYSRHSAVNFSSLKWMAVSPLHYRYWLAHKLPDTPSMELGRAVHMAVLEPQRFMHFEDAPRKRTRRISDAPTMWQVADIIAGHVASNKEAASLLRYAETERSVLWEMDGIKCKARVDAIKHGRVIELKTTRSIVGFRNAVRRYHYDAQLAWYCDAIGFDMAAIIVAETQPPYDVATCEVPRAMLARGRETYRGWWSQLVQCMRTDSWPGVGEIRLDEDEIDMGLDDE